MNRLTTTARDPDPQRARPRQRDPLGQLTARGRAGFGAAGVLLAFIVLPGIVLGYLSMRALEKERAYSLEELHESHMQLARLAARQIDRQLRDLEARWTSAIESVLGKADSLPSPSRLAAGPSGEPLIDEYFAYRAPGRPIYPATVPPDAGIAGESRESHVRDHEAFTRLVARGEELEYPGGDLDGALAVYREILDQVSTPQLRAMAETYIGRIQLKGSQWNGALETFRHVLENFPETRDLNRMYLRFLAQYQIAIAFEGLGREHDALETLFALSQDLLQRSDAINTPQYAYYADLIQTTASPLLRSQRDADRERYESAFRSLDARHKKPISERYLMPVLDAALNEWVVRGSHFNTQMHYLTSRAEGEPFLLAYRTLPDPARVHTLGLLAARIDLKQLHEEVSRSIQNLQSSSGVTVAILGPEGKSIADSLSGRPVATEDLGYPFDFWQVAVYPRNDRVAMQWLDLRTTLWLWLISMLLLSMLFGTYLFIRRVRRDAYISRAQTTFVSNVTHELRTPLSSIKMFAELMEMQLAAAAGTSVADFRKSAEQHLGIIRQECDRLSRLIDRVIDFSKTERRVQRYHFEYHDVGTVVSGVIESFRPQAEAERFRLGLSIEDRLPLLEIDVDAMSQVVLNLLSNALNFSKDTRDIQVAVRRDGPAVVIDVTDRGVGIGPKEMERVFDKFYSSRRRMDSRTQSGLGLGLTLSREIVRAHGGEIRVRSRPGAGSTFSVVLPIPRAAVATPPPSPTEPDRVPGTHESHR